MVLAVAALLLQFGHAAPAVPAAAASAANAAAARSAPIATAPELPDAPVPSNQAAGAVTPVSNPAPNPSASSRPATTRPAATLRVASLDPSGNDTQALSMIHIPEDDQPFRRVSVEAMPSSRKWLALSVAQHSAATFDAYATRRAIATGAYEEDPLMRPFAGSSGIYAAIQVCPLVLDYAAKRMQRSQNALVRHTWWLPQSLGTGMYLFSGAHDLKVAGR